MTDELKNAPKEVLAVAETIINSPEFADTFRILGEEFAEQIALAAQRGYEAGRAIREGDGEWHTVDSAPTDGTPVWAISMEAQSPAPRVSWIDPDGRWVRVHTAEKFVVSGPVRWWPTHWKQMSPPASPIPATGGEKE